MKNKNIIFKIMLISIFVLILYPKKIFATTSMSQMSISLSKYVYTYSGTACTPTVTVKHRDRKVNSSNYTVKYSNNYSAGTGKVTITGKGSYTGTVTKTFTINRRPIKDCSINLSSSSYTYTGARIEPGVTVKYGSKIASSNYTVSYKNNISAGTGTVTITGKNNYTGTVTKTFTINKRSIKDCSINLSSSSYTYTGQAIKPSVTIKYGSTVNSSNYTIKYSNNISAGTGTVTITGKNNYTGTVTKTFTINKKQIKDYSINLSSSSYTYTGRNIEPRVTVDQIDSSNYTISYNNNINVGTGTVTITGKNNYTGTVTKTFKINKQHIDECNITVDCDEYEYDGTSKCPTITIKYNNHALIKDKDYEISTGGNHSQIGCYSITIYGIGNFDYFKVITYKIVPHSLKKCVATIKGGKTEYAYTGNKITPEIIVKDKSTNKEVNSKYYKVTYLNNVKAGTASIYIEGQDMYEGKIKINFYIKFDMNKLLAFANSFIGTKYIYGGTTPDGFDCSGFVQYVYRKFGYELPRTANMQAKEGASVNFIGYVQPGDLVFFNTSQGINGHVGIYIGNGKFIHAASKECGVCISSFYNDDVTQNYYAQVFSTARRIIN